MQLSRARRLSSASTVLPRRFLMSVCRNILSLAFEYSTHFGIESRSIEGSASSASPDCRRDP